MPVGLLGKKVGMTQVYDANGVVVPVTVIELGPCTVLQVKTVDSDGYEAVQVGFEDKLSQKDLARPEGQRKRTRANRAERGHVVALKSKRQQAMAERGVEAPPKAGCEAKRFVREFRVDGEQHGLDVGQELKADVFADVKAVDVVATSKGRGTTGVMKRHNFQGQRATHGVKKVHRMPGGIGQATDPARVWKGKRMAGRYGGTQVTVRNLDVVSVDAENNMLLINGAVPGPNGGYVVVRVAK
ncbi:50S ribosomal protein L3 [Thalassoglobus sp. JC818]|uniref:50S ribosomal protein L3 n=1 Tax=Thalassoglobus sp. JC818 TaxID=3232136 RepID=UPI003459DAFC